MKVSQQKKEQILELLQKTPIIEVVCSKSGISKATLYNWKKDDPDFARLVDEAMNGGKDFVSDLAEGKLIAAIQANNLSAAIFWLKSHRSDYRTRVELSGEVRHVRESLTEDEAELLGYALELSGMEPGILEIKKDDHQPNDQTLKELSKN